MIMIILNVVEKKVQPKKRMQLKYLCVDSPSAVEYVGVGWLYL